MKVGVWAALVVASVTTPVWASAQKPEAQVREIILSTRHLGAHGMGYNTRSTWQLSKKLVPADVPVLIKLASGESDIRVGAQFGLASQCGPALSAVRDAVQDAGADRRFVDLSAEDTLQLISEFEGCKPQVRHDATDALTKLRQLREDERQRINHEAKRKAENDSRIQQNGIKLLDPEQAKTLTRQERLEIFHRSLTAMGLKEDGPMTPEQKRTIDRMYRSMVLDEAKTPP